MFFFLCEVSFRWVLAWIANSSPEPARFLAADQNERSLWKWVSSPQVWSLTSSLTCRLLFIFYSPRRLSIKEPPPPNENDDDDLDRMLKDFQEQRAAKALQRQWRGYQGRKQRIKQEDEDRQNQAAFTLQKNWRKHRDRVQSQSLFLWLSSDSVKTWTKERTTCKRERERGVERRFCEFQSFIFSSTSIQKKEQPEFYFFKIFKG